jgi:hypothetical protein
MKEIFKKIISLLEEKDRKMCEFGNHLVSSLVHTDVGQMCQKCAEGMSVTSARLLFEKT